MLPPSRDDDDGGGTDVSSVPFLRFKSILTFPNTCLRSDVSLLPHANAIKIPFGFLICNKKKKKKTLTHLLDYVLAAMMNPPWCSQRSLFESSARPCCHSEGSATGLWCLFSPF